MSQSAPVEAERHSSVGLSLIPSVSEGRERDALEVSLLVKRAYALVALKSITAPETFEVMSAAKRLLDRGVGTDLQRVSVLFGLCSEATLGARKQPALDFAHQIIEVAEQQDDPTYRLVAYRMLATNQYYAGHNRIGLDSLLRGKRYRDPTRQRALSHRFGWDPSLAILSFEVLVRRVDRQRSRDQRAGTERDIYPYPCHNDRDGKVLRTNLAQGGARRLCGTGAR